MRCFFRILGLSVFLCVITAPARAESLTIFGDASEPPKSYLMSDGRAAGQIVDVVRYIAKDSGIDFHIKLLPWKRAYFNAINGKGLIMSLSRTAEREKIFDYTDPIYYDDVVLVTVDDHIHSFNSLDDLRGMNLAMNLGSSYGDAFDSAIRSGLFVVTRVGTRTSWYRMLLHGRVDGVVAAQGAAGVRAVLHEDPELWKLRDRFRIFDHPIRRDPNYIGIPKSLSSPDLIRRINHAIARYWKEIEMGKTG